MSLDRDERGVSLKYTDVNGVVQVLHYDTILSELKIAGSVVPLLNLSRISQVEHIVILTYQDGSSRTIITSNSNIATTVRQCVYLACTAYALEKASHERTLLGLLDPTELATDCLGVFICRTHSTRYNDAEPHWIYRVIVLTNKGYRIEYNINEVDDCQRLRKTHFPNMGQ